MPPLFVLYSVVNPHRIMRVFPDRRFWILSSCLAHAKPRQERLQTRIDDTPPPPYSTNAVMEESLRVEEGAELLFDVCSSVSFWRQAYKHKFNNSFRLGSTGAASFPYTHPPIAVDSFPSAVSTYIGSLNGCFLFIFVFIRGHIRYIEHVISLTASSTLPSIAIKLITIKIKGW